VGGGWRGGGDWWEILWQYKNDVAKGIKKDAELKSLPLRLLLFILGKEMERRGTKDNKKKHKEETQKTGGTKSPLCHGSLKEADHQWPLSNIHKVNSFSKHPSWSLKDMLLAERGNKCTAKCSTGSEPSALWVLVPRGRGTKTGETLNALLFWVLRGAEGPSMLVVLALAPSEREGLYTSSVAA